MYTLRRQGNIVDTIQFWGSFLFVSTRIMKTMYCAAEINDVSGDILMSIHEFPASQWNLEMRRLRQALSTEIVALSGNKFFYITRRLIFGVNYDIHMNFKYKFFSILDDSDNGYLSLSYD